MFKIAILILCLSQINASLDSTNKEFWERLNIASYAPTKSVYNTYVGQNICMTCPIDRTLYRALIHRGKNELQRKMGDHYNGEMPNKILINWSTFINGKLINLCSNNTKSTKNAIFLPYMKSREESTILEFTCENDRVCLNNMKNFYPKSFTCNYGFESFEVTSNVLIDFKSLVNDWINKYII